MAKETKIYDFGEKKEETINGNKVPVEFHTPKYKEAKKKATELLESDEYKNVLEPSDFWILVNTYANKTKAMYSGLIISHDGCLKINDSLDEKLRFKPECMKIDKEGYNNSLVFSYICAEQGLYEVGEVSKDNCKNDYPYAMVLKRCFDRVVLKNSKIAYSGIYSDSESDEFLKRTESEDSTPSITNEEEAKAYKLAFGKYTGKTLGEVPKNYLQWLLENSKDETVKTACDFLVEHLTKEEHEEKAILLDKMKNLVFETNTDLDKMLKHYNVQSNSEMTIEQLKDAIGILTMKKQHS